MPLILDYKNVKNAYAKIIRIWGSKAEGWFAWVGIFNKKGDQDPIDTVLVSAGYVDGENPYPKLYKVFEELNVKPVAAGVVADLETEPVVKKVGRKKKS